MMDSRCQFVDAPQFFGRIVIHMEVVSVGLYVGVDLHAGTGDHGRTATGAICKVGDDCLLKGLFPVLECMDSGGVRKYMVFK